MFIASFDSFLLRDFVHSYQDMRTHCVKLLKNMTFPMVIYLYYVVPLSSPIHSTSLEMSSFLVEVECGTTL